MLSGLLALCGYMKIANVPLETIQLSMMQEKSLRDLIEASPKNTNVAKIFEEMLRGQIAITQFLRSLRKLSQH
jgi:hypothetical protein